MRFQIAFAIAGFGLWMFFFERKYSKILPVFAGFLIGAILNTYLDFRFYHEFVFTPYNYFHVNIIEGKAASFGTSSFIRYIGLLIGVISVPPLSIFLLYYCLKGSFKHYNYPIVISIIFFIVAHCFVGHKEDRFIFPVLNAMPVMVGLGLPIFMNYYQSCKKWIHNFLKSILIFSISLNLVLLVLLVLNPYSQTVEFSRLLKDRFKEKTVIIYCLARTPFETQSGLPLVFYKKNLPQVTLQKLSINDSVRYIKSDFIATTFNQVKNDMPMLDSLGYRPVLYSSDLLWNINKYLFSKKINTINDIWVLYEKE